MKLAWFSPLYYPCTSKAAEYSQALLSVFPSDWEVEFFLHERELERAKDVLGDKGKFFHYHQLRERQLAWSFDATIYQIEDIPECHYILDIMETWPGIAFFHDLNLFRSHLGRFNHTTIGRDINEFLSSRLGEKAPQLGDYHVRRWSKEVFEKYYPIPESRRSSWNIKVVHQTLRRFSLATLNFNPSFDIAQSCFSREELREKYGLPNVEHVLTFSGTHPLADNFLLLLESLETLSLEHEFFLQWLVFSKEEETSIQKFLNDYGSNFSLKKVALTRVQAKKEATERITASDLYLLLSRNDKRSPISPVYWALQVGTPVAAFDSVELEGLPCIKIPVECAQGDVLAQVLKECLQSDTIRKRVAEEGRAFCAQHTTAKNAFREFQQIVVSNIPRVREQESGAKKMYQDESRRLVSKLSLEEKGSCIKDFNWDKVSFLHEEH